MSLKALQTEHLAVKMSIERRVRGLVGLMFECVSQATPPLPKMSLCAAMATARVLAEADVIVNLLLRRREANGVMERKRERRGHFCPTGNETSCAHSSWPNTDELIHTLIYIHTFSQNCGLLSICSPKSASTFLLLSALISVFYCLFLSLFCSIIGTIQHQTFFPQAGL